MRPVLWRRASCTSVGSRNEAKTLPGHVRARCPLRSWASGTIQATRQFFDGLAQGLWEGFVSPLVLEEVSRAPDRVKELIARELQRCSPSVLEESQESVTLARAYVEAGAIPVQYEDDARHIAVATVNDIKVIVSWNFRHMVNIDRKRWINSVR